MPGKAAKGAAVYFRIQRRNTLPARSRSQYAQATATPCSTTRFAASILNSRQNIRLVKSAPHFHGHDLIFLPTKPGAGQAAFAPDLPAWASAAAYREGQAARPARWRVCVKKLEAMIARAGPKGPRRSRRAASRHPNYAHCHSREIALVRRRRSLGPDEVQRRRQADRRDPSCRHRFRVTRVDRSALFIGAMRKGGAESWHLLIRSGRTTNGGLAATRWLDVFEA